VKTLLTIIGSDETADDIQRARELGRLCAERGWVVVTGGRPAGVMEAACAGAKEVEGSLTVGILPSRSTEPSRYVDIPIYTDLENARNNVNVLSGRVVIACGARGAGTISEIALAIKNGRPVVLLACDSLAEALFGAFGNVHIASTPEAAIELASRLIASAAPPPPAPRR
jgi:uncharacterized protein (TIGR00725 family)